MVKGWIKLYRSLSDWEWYDDDPCFRLLIHLLLTVNYEDKKWKGIIVPAGSRVCSWDTLEGELKTLTVQKIRTAMRKLEECGEVTRKTTNKYQIVSLVKWEELQCDEDETNSQEHNILTGNQQTTNRPLTTTKESKEIKESKNKEYNLLVEKCFDRCIEFFPEDLKPKNDSKWKETIEKLNRIDKVPFEKIIEIVKWAREDDFWRTNFLSISKLRTKDRNDVKYFIIFNEQMKKYGTRKNKSEHRAEEFRNF